MQNTPPLDGVISATLTPFVSNTGPVAYDLLPAHLRFLEAQGINGVLPMGTTGEGPSLSMDERKRIVDLVLEHRGSLFTIISSGCASLIETIALSRYALEGGADAIMVMPPFYLKAVSDEGVVHYYRGLFDALPGTGRVLLYHIPKITGVPITAAIIERLLDSHGAQFYGIKDSSGDPQHTANLVESYPHLRIYSGSDSQIASSLAAGASGIISALSNVWPQRVRAVYDAHHQGGDVEAAQQQVLQIRNATKTPNLQPALKAALPWYSDLPRTSVRAPLTNLTDQEVAQLQAALQML